MFILIVRMKVLFKILWFEEIKKKNVWIGILKCNNDMLFCISLFEKNLFNELI